MNNILVIDDDTRLRNLLGRFLGENNFNVELAKDTLEAREILENHNFNLLIVDVMMPNENGIDFVSDFRKNHKTPIIMLTARGEFEDRIKGLEAGADDYLQKPFEPKELLLRINNILKRFGSPSNKVDDKNNCHFGDFTFSFSDFRLKKGDKFIHITDSEANILNILCQKKGISVNREDISKLCGGIDVRSIDVQITRLRRKIEENPKKPNYLQTIRNSGYVIYS